MSNSNKKRKLNDEEHALETPPKKKLKRDHEISGFMEQTVFVVMCHGMEFAGYKSLPQQSAELVGIFDSLKQANKCAKATYCKKIDCWDPLYDGRISNDEFSDIDDDDDDVEDKPYTKTTLAHLDTNDDDNGRERTIVWVLKQKVQKIFDKENNTNTNSII
eukprot:589817_1